MRERTLKIASVVTVAGLVIVAGIAAMRLPADTHLPIHWNAAGQADRFATASHALAMPVLLAAGLSLLFVLLPRIEPLQQRLAASAPLLRTAWAGLLAMMVLIEAVIAAPAFGRTLPASTPMLGLGLLLIMIGNVLPKSRPGFFVGIRTPWTLGDTDNWVATHRLGAWTMIGGGLLILLAAMLPITGDARATMVRAALTLAIVPPLVYSFLFWRRHRGERQTDGR